MDALPPGLGLIEGFYGRMWSREDRLLTLDFLGSCGYHHYVYAPKGDASLRRQWRARWDEDTARHVRELAARARAAGLRWGIGLSPLGLVEDFSAAAIADFRSKLRYLDDFAPDLLCLLFDDMPRGVDDMALRQAELARIAAELPRIRHLVVCPSYYSRDPVLERIFGAMPVRYWEELGEGLPPEAAVFWTGERVCSTSYPDEDLRDIAARLRRPVTLWDNYPVNDGARMSRFLHLSAFRDRPARLARLTQAHFVNPMNQCRLSWLPLSTLPLSYAQGEGYDPVNAFAAAARAQLGEAGAGLLGADLELLERHGLDGIAPPDRARLLARYGAIPEPWAREIVEWLQEAYAFDPACLTD